MMATSLNDKNSVRAFIKKNLVSYKFRSQPQRFLSNSALDTVTDREVIRQIVAQDKKMILNNQDQERLVDRIHDDGRKLFIITCVSCDKSVKYVKVMLENGLTDKNLPLGENDFGSLSEKGSFVENFMGAQKRFNTVRFHENDFIKLDDDLSDYFSVPIHFEDIPANFKGKGAFGEVYKVKIHPDQRSFSCVSSF
jgi:hypothetical protein